MKNIVKYILILSTFLILCSGCGQDTHNHITYENPLSKKVNERNTEIINKSNNAVEITVKYDMDKEQYSFVDAAIKDMEHKGYAVARRKNVESTRILSTNPDVLQTVIEYQIITYKKIM